MCFEQKAIRFRSVIFVDYDYDYYGYGDYRGGYGESYYDDYYRYEDFYFDYPPPAVAASAPRGGRGGRQPQPVGPIFSTFFFF